MLKKVATLHRILSDWWPSRAKLLSNANLLRYIYSKLRPPPIQPLNNAYGNQLTKASDIQEKTRAALDKRLISLINNGNSRRMASSHEGRSLDDLYHEAYALVEQGICYDEIGDRDGALRMYEHGLELIDVAGKKPNATSNPSYKKMMQAKDHIDDRLKDLRGDSTAAAGNNKAKAGSSSPQPAPYEAINGAIEAFGSKEVDEIFLIPHGVQLFMIEGEETTVPTYPEELKIYKFHGDAAHAPAGAEAFIQVGSWVYPLMRGRSPVLHSDFGAYVFPNPTDEKP
uniref:Inheritance of peroxisomes protein 1 n=1 Tax=Plectus sambesii TaxID=2011161 RepID=A0A914X6B8_9BILA